jgi:hypothetical protein
VEKFLGTREKRILFQMTPNDDHRVRPHDVDHGIPAELLKMVGAEIDRPELGGPGTIAPYVK